MRLIALSDTHNQLDKIKLPQGELLIISGDLTMSGTAKELRKLNDDLKNVRELYGFQHIIIIAGNHDWLFQDNKDEAKSLITNAFYLEDEAIIINGINVYGSPHQPFFHSWAFNEIRGTPIKAKWDLIPTNTDILITHGPPRGFGDRTLGYMGSPPENVGCDDLLNAIQEKKIKIHICGHIHSGYGIIKTPETIYINASTCNEKYQPINPPIIIDIDKNKPIAEWTIEHYKPLYK